MAVDYTQSDFLFSDTGPGTGFSWQAHDPANCSGPGLDCVIILHEATTGWWFAPNVTNCQGDCPGAPSNPPVPLDLTLCEQAWLEEVSVQLGHLPTLGDIFPSWALSQAVIDPTLHFNLDGGVIVCGQNWIQIKITITPQKVQTCPQGQHWDAAQGKCVPDQTTPTCPSGFHWDATQQKCVPNQTTPTCPPGQHWDATLQQCVPNTTGGKGTKLPCPPYQAVPDCLPQPPGVDPNLDEIGDGFAASAYWLMILAIYVGNLFQTLSASGSGGNTGTGGNPDQVTCAQLTGLFRDLIAAINAISSSGGTTAPFDWTPLLTVLEGTPLVNPKLPAVPVFTPPPAYTLLDAATDIDAGVQILFDRTVPFGQ